MNKRTKQIIEILKMRSSRHFEGDGIYSQIEYLPEISFEDCADAILALPIEVPRDDEIESKANGIANPESKKDFERGEWLGVKEGARWACSEIIKRNRP